MNIETLDTHGFVAVRYPIHLRMRVQEAMNAWIRFCELPQHEKNMLAGGDRIEDFGYMLRGDRAANADSKELFHLLQARERELMAKAEGVTDRRAVEFIRAVDVLIHSTKDLVREFAENVEARYRCTGFIDEVMNSSHLWTFRFLHYFGGEMLANAHADRLGFTLHLHESDSGGEYLGFDGAWKPWPVNHEQTIIFPSIGLQHRTESQVKALWHRVVPTEKTKADGRYAMVAFIDFPQAREWDKHKYPRVQDFAPGFNYGMPFSKLDSYFKTAA